MPVGARERILDVASELFYAEGLRAVGIDTVIARAGVAKASLYKHFSSKDDLIVAVLERRDAAWRAWLAETVDKEAESAVDKPLAIFDAVISRFDQHGFAQVSDRRSGLPGSRLSCWALAA